MTETTAEQVGEELRLSPQQVLTVCVLQARMLRADLKQEKKAARAKRKRLYLFVTEAFRDTVPDDFPAWVPAELAGFGELSNTEQIVLFTSLAKGLAEHVDTRSAALIILAELMTFSPWDDGSSWNKKARNASLERAAEDLGSLRDSDLQAMTDEFESLMKALRRKSIRWGRVAAVTVVGAGLGVVTGGLAAPAIGGIVGGTMGLTGAAATSAGLAALGGGSLAAGGFGVAGGTLLLTGLGGVAFAGAAAAGTRLSPVGARAIAAEAVKLDLIARMILVDSPNRDEKMRRVVESLQETINRLSDRTVLLVDRVNELKKLKAESDSENAALREEIKAVRAELDEVKAALTTLSVVLDRVPKAITA